MKKTILIMGLCAWLMLGATSCRKRMESPVTYHPPETSIPVLMYHDIGDDPDRDVWTVSTDEFRSQVADLKAGGFQTILFSDLFSKKTLPPKPIILTFDDGCQGVLTRAEPILKEADFRAISYLITEVVADTPADRMMYRTYPSLTWEEIRAMRDRGTFTFGSHSHSHSAAHARQVEEISGVRALYHEKMKDKSNTTFSDYAYPYGGFSDSLIEALTHVGFRTAVICEDRVWDPRIETNLFLIPRVSIYGGRHEFHIEYLPSEPADSVSARVFNNGLPLPVIILLRDLSTDATYPLTPERRLDATPQLLVWSNLPPSAVHHPQLEIWEQNQLFRYAISAP